MTPYILILVTVFAIAPFAIGLAQKQDKKTKARLKNAFLFLLAAQIILGLFNWHVFSLFLAISLIQVFLLVKKNPAEAPAALLNFINTIILFSMMIGGDQNQRSNSTNLIAVATAFIVLIGNVVGLLLANKNRKLAQKQFPRRKKLGFFFILLLALSVILGLSYKNRNARETAIAKISALPDEKEYLRAVPSGIVALDHEDKEAHSYSIHVYEIKDGHAATFNWYEVNKMTGEIKATGVAVPMSIN